MNWAVPSRVTRFPVVAHLVFVTCQNNDHLPFELVLSQHLDYLIQNLQTKH